jgi:integrase
LRSRAAGARPVVDFGSDEARVRATRNTARDWPGLVFRITAKGVRTWAFRFRDRRTGKQGRAKIGAYPSTTLEAARSAASALRKIVDAGGNPTQERRTGGPNSFKALAARYLAAVKDPRSDWYKRSHAADERNLRKHVLPQWGERRSAAITRADVVELTTGLVAAGTPTLANRVQSLISNIFSFALDGGELQAHPCFRLRKRGKERVGSRVLTDDEMRLFWREVIDTPAVMRTGLGLRLILATGTRVSEVALMNRAATVATINAARLSGMRFVIGPWTSVAYLHLHARVLRPRASRALAQAP